MQQDETSQFIGLIVKQMDFKELRTNCLKLWFQEKSHEALPSNGELKCHSWMMKGTGVVQLTRLLQICSRNFEGTTLFAQTVCQIRYSLSSSHWYWMRNNPERQYKASSV